MIKNFKIFELRGRFTEKPRNIEKDNNYTRYVIRKYNQRGEIVLEHPVRSITDAYETYKNFNSEDSRTIIVEETKRILSNEEIQRLLDTEKYNL